MTTDELKEGSEVWFEGYGIFHNHWGEYCVLTEMTGSMVSYNAGFPSLAAAKAFIQKLKTLEEPSQKDIEQLAIRYKK